MRWHVNAALFVMASMTVGCAGPKLFEARELPQNLAQVRKPSPGKSMVVFILPGDPSTPVWGNGRGINVLDDRTVVAHCVGRTYTQYECSPGKHLFAAACVIKGNGAWHPMWAAWTPGDLTFMEADLLSDRVYYVKLSAYPGAWTDHANIWPLYPGCEGKAWDDLPKCLAHVKETTLGPEMDSWVNKNSDRMNKVYDACYGPWSTRNDHKVLLPEHGQVEPVLPEGVLGAAVSEN